MKMQKSVTFAKKNLKKKKKFKDKKYRKVRDHCQYTGEYRGAVYGICNLEYNVPKKIPVDFHNGFNRDCHFIVYELAEEFKKQFTCLEKNTETYITLQFQQKKKLQELIKMEKKLQKYILHITIY